MYLEQVQVFPPGVSQYQKHGECAGLLERGPAATAPSNSKKWIHNLVGLRLWFVFKAFINNSKLYYFFYLVNLPPPLPTRSNIKINISSLCLTYHQFLGHRVYGDEFILHCWAFWVYNNGMLSRRSATIPRRWAQRRSYGIGVTLISGVFQDLPSPTLIQISDIAQHPPPKKENKTL